jgi:hypothetical protein
MTFTEAIIQATKGKKITRREWGEGWVEINGNQFIDDKGKIYIPYFGGCICDDWEIYEEEEPETIKVNVFLAVPMEMQNVDEIKHYRDAELTLFKHYLQTQVYGDRKCKIVINDVDYKAPDRANIYERLDKLALSISNMKQAEYIVFCYNPIYEQGFEELFAEEKIAQIYRKQYDWKVFERNYSEITPDFIEL